MESQKKIFLTVILLKMEDNNYKININYTNSYNNDVNPDENAGLRCRVLEVEASLGSEEALTELSGELAQLRKRNEVLGNELRSREEEIELLRAGISGGPHGDALKVHTRSLLI